MKIIFLAWAVLIAGRLFYLQIIVHDRYTQQAEKQRFDRRVIEGDRGKIFLKDLKIPDKYYPLATNIEFYTVAVSPKQVQAENQAEFIGALGSFLDVSTTTISEKIEKKDDVYEVIKRNVSGKTANAISSSTLKGVILERELGRFYPEKEDGAHLSGFVGFKGSKRIGQYGLEAYYEDALGGEEGTLEAEFDAGGRIITTGSKYVKEPETGSDIYLTVDRTIQFFACDKLKSAVKKHGATSGSVIIMDPFSGRILAMCNYPTFDPNEYSKVKNISLYVNPSVSYTYEPGSVFKPITMAGALNEGVIDSETQYHDTGSVKIGPYVIKNSDLKAHGVRTMTQVLEDSLNTGAIFAVRNLGAAKFRKYVSDFGFGGTTGIDTSSEVSGDISSLDKPSEIYSATASFGQGIAVTSIQMLTAYAAIANGGYVLRPFIVDSIRGKDGIELKKPKILRQIISGQTASKLSAMLVSVVEKGHGARAQVKGYYVAGKTGTAQVPLPGGGYDPNRSIGSFIGFAPLKNPKFVMLAKVDDPKDVRFAESTAAPLFGEIAKFLLDYLEVPPERKL